MTYLASYNDAIRRRRLMRAVRSDVHKADRRAFQAQCKAAYDIQAAEKQRLRDMCEDAGLVFCLPSLNPYSGE